MNDKIPKRRGRDTAKRKRARTGLAGAQEDLKQVNKILEEERRRFHNVLDMLPAYVILLTPEYRAAFANRRFKEEFGEAGERRCYEFLFQRSEPCENCMTYRVLDTGRPLEWEWKGPNGKLYQVFDFPFTDSDGSKLILEMGLDVTDRKAAEETIRRQATLYEGMLRATRDGFCLFDKESRLVDANNAYLRMSGYKRDELLSLSVADLEAVESPDDVIRHIQAIAAHGFDRFETRHRRKDGSTFDVEISASYSPVSERMMTFVRDITETKKVESYVRQLQKLEALGTLAGGIAHDFNNILVPIFLNTEIAQLETPADSPVRRRLDIVLEAVNRGRELVRQVISFSRKADQRREPIDLTLIVREALGLLKASLPGNVILRERLSAEDPFIVGDPTQIHQVLMNLGANARDAMKGAGGEIDVKLESVEIGREAASTSPGLKAGPHLKLTVADTGIGIPPDVLDKVFEPFFTTKKPGEGTGMGLPVVMGIVRGHGGSVSISSEVGKGTRFEVLLPKAKPGVRPAPKEPGPAPGGKGRILFVDDEPMVVRTVAPLLEGLGYSVVSTTDPAAALDRFRADPLAFDLVITDQTMAPMTGDRLGREILEIRPGIPVLLCTGFSEIITEDVAIERGMAGLILKPFTSGEIAVKIREILSR